jgi:hypothetical protein
MLRGEVVFKRFITKMRLDILAFMRTPMMSKAIPDVDLNSRTITQGAWWT